VLWPLVCFAKTGLQALAAVKTSGYTSGWDLMACLISVSLPRPYALIDEQPQNSNGCLCVKTTHSHNRLTSALSSKGSSKPLGTFRVSAIDNITQRANMQLSEGAFAIIHYHSRLELCFQYAHMCHFSDAKLPGRRALVDQAMYMLLLMRCMSKS
jgi:hypothetical protein